MKTIATLKVSASFDKITILVPDGSSLSLTPDCARALADLLPRMAGISEILMPRKENNVAENIYTQILNEPNIL